MDVPDQPHDPAADSTRNVRVGNGNRQKWPSPSISPRISIGTGQLQNWSFPGLDPVDSDSRIEQSGRCSGSAELRGYVQNIY